MKLRLKQILFALPVASFFLSCSPQKTEEVAEEVMETKTPSLTLLWETADSLITVESVLFDEATGTIYVSNIEGQDPLEKDGKGSIGIIDQSGNIINASWVSGLNAPKGMAILDGKLYVTDIDELVEIDIATATISNKWKVEGAQFLNDVAAHEGKVYFTDMNTGKLHGYENGEVITISEGHSNLNGIALASDGTIYGLDDSGLIKWDWDGGTELINTTVTGGDGLVILGDGNFVASRWVGEIYFVNGNTETLLLDTKAMESNTADIGYNPSEKIIYVPTFFKNKVAAYTLDY